jgi:hypothetical protein
MDAMTNDQISKLRRRCRRGLPVIGCAAVIAAWLGAGDAAFGQQDDAYRGTASDRAACTPDVFRLCWGEVPNVSGIVACLKRERPRLSPGCRAVFQPAPTRVAKKRFRRHHRVAAD